MHGRVRVHADELLLRLVTRDEAPEPRGARLSLCLHALCRLVGAYNVPFGHELRQASASGLVIFAVRPKRSPSVESRWPGGHRFRTLAARER